MESKKGRIVINPKSGGGNGEKQRDLVTSQAVELGWKGEFGEATSEKRGSVWAAEAAKQGIEEFIIGGGDGTVRDVLKPAADGNLTVGILPMGTGNVLAKNLDIPMDTGEALKIALFGNVRQIDLGEANGNYFGVVVGMGLDVEAMRKTKKIAKSRWGMFAYLWNGLRSLSEPGEKYLVTINNKERLVFRARSIMVVNVAKTVAGIELAPGAGVQSGDLKVVIMWPAGLKSWVNLIAHILRKTAQESPYYRLYRAQQVEIVPLNGPQRYECDGDEFPPTDNLKIRLHPGALKVRVPSDEMTNRMVEEKKKVLIFDFDGTIADSWSTTVEIFKTLAKRHNYINLNSDQIERMRGLSALQALEQLGISKSRLPGLLLEGRREFVKYHPVPDIFLGMKETLLQLKSKYGLGIVTSNDAKNVDAFLKKNDIQVFDFIYTEKSIFGKTKVFSRLMKEYGFNSSQLIYVGDEVRDIDAAHSSNIKVITVAWGFNTKDVLMKNNPDWVIDRPEDLLKMNL